MNLSESFVLVVGVLAAGLMIHIAWYDYRHLTIRNGAVLLLLALYGVFAALTGFSSLAGDLAAGAVLFVPGFAMWLMRMMGAGDVKLYFAIGLFMGLDGLWMFSLLLLGVSLVFLMILQAARLIRGRSGVVTKLQKIRESGEAPYAVVMCAASIPVIVLRFLAWA